MIQFRSVLLWLGVALTTIIWFFPCLFARVFIAPFDKNRVVNGLLADIWGMILVTINPLWRVTIAGKENIVRGQAYVLCANHQSMGDIIVADFLPARSKWVSKEIVFKVPLMGQAMTWAGYVALKRGDKDSAKEAMNQAAEWLRRGMSVSMFPEGTRSEDGKLLPFKEGAFRLAVETGKPILPVAIYGSKYMLPRGSWLFTHKVHVHLAVMPPIPVQGSGDGEVKRLMEATRQALERGLEDMAQVAAIDRNFDHSGTSWPAAK